MKNLGERKKAQLENWELEMYSDYTYFGYRTVGHYGNTYTTTKELFFSNEKFTKDDVMYNNSCTES